jgi:hypothetical protein
MLGRSEGSRQDALDTARVLVARGFDFDAIVVRLCGTGLDEGRARAIAAEAFKPPLAPTPTLGAELAAIEAMLDRATGRDHPPIDG